MNEYIKIIKEGFDDGITNAINDQVLNKKKKFIKINKLEIKSKLYDISYIYGYKTYIKIINNKSLN